MPFRRTWGIVSDLPDGDPSRWEEEAALIPKFEADVIMTAATLGLTHYVREQNGLPIEFGYEPLDEPSLAQMSPQDRQREEEKYQKFVDVAWRIDDAVWQYFVQKGVTPGDTVRTRPFPPYYEGAVVVGVYELADHPFPNLWEPPDLSIRGQELYGQIVRNEIPQYVGRGAYTGFVDDATGQIPPIGPRSTVRFCAPDSDELYPRWLPPADSPLWHPRLRLGTPDDFVPWGLIGGDLARMRTTPGMRETNKADQTTVEMEADGMVFDGIPGIYDIANYTHGMIQAIYGAYGYSPSCVPYEIPVGKLTKKMASCLACTLFMVANEYPPTSTHLGRGESWAPLYYPYNVPYDPELTTEEQAMTHAIGTVRDLNNRWYDLCKVFLNRGLDILEGVGMMADHVESAACLRHYLLKHPERTVAATLILDALSMHDGELDRLDRTLPQFAQ
jgi:hypothetical protein